MFINSTNNIFFYFYFLLIPISIIAGSSISLINILAIDISFLILIILRKDFYFLKSRIF